MTVEAWSITPPYTIGGTGPYTITHPYVEGAIRAYVRLDTGLLALSASDFAVSPSESETTGNLTLSPTAATTHAGRPLIIDRVTPDEQGWLAVLGEREAGLASQLDRMVQATQELRVQSAGALRIRGELDAFDWEEGTIPILEDGKVRSGPTADAIAAAQANAIAADQARIAAQAARDEAITKENSMLRDRGAWASLTLYSPSDIFTSNGTSYITQVAHIASSIAADLAANRIRVFAAKGDAGPGSGDMLKSENLSGLTNVPQARTNLGLQALATKSLAAFADIDPAAVITDVEGLAANKIANALPVAKAVTDYVDAFVPVSLAFHGVPTNGSYTMSGTLVTVTMTAHGMVSGEIATLDFTTGSATDGAYVVTVVDANTFTVVDSASGATSGNVTRLAYVLSGSRGVAYVGRAGTGDYTVYFAPARPNASYSFQLNNIKTADTPWTYWAEARSLADITAATLRLRTGYVSGTSFGGYNAFVDSARVCLQVFG